MNFKSTKKGYLDIDNCIIPAIIYRERRSSVAASITRNAAILRVPVLETNIQKHITWFREWVHQQLEENEELKARYKNHQIKDGAILTITGRQYQMKLVTTDHQKHIVSLKEGFITCQISNKDSVFNQQKKIRELLAKVIAADNIHLVRQRVVQLNQLHFQQPIHDIKLTYTQSQWGSCSTDGVINLSVRLLFTPPIVQDYVIIHELAHLLEMNHGPRFWALVKRAMPDYKQWEAWLDEHGPGCDF